MTIELHELRKVMVKLIDDLMAQGHTAIEIEHDYYWEINSDQLYDPSKEPTKLTLGQLTYDWERVQRILRAEHDPLALALAWLAPILRYVGEKIVH